MKISLFCSSRIFPAGKTSVPLDALTDSNRLPLPIRQSSYIDNAIRLDGFHVKSTARGFKIEVYEIALLSDEVVLKIVTKIVGFYRSLRMI